jgi:hypothetical protein
MDAGSTTCPLTASQLPLVKLSASAETELSPPTALLPTPNVLTLTALPSPTLDASMEYADALKDTLQFLPLIQTLDSLVNQSIKELVMDMLAPAINDVS